MRTMSAKDAKNHFGELLLEAQKAPVTIEKNGRPVAVLLSIEEHEAAEKMKLERLRVDDRRSRRRDRARRGVRLDRRPFGRRFAPKERQSSPPRNPRVTEARRVTLAAPARRDLAEIWSWIAVDNGMPARRRACSSRLREACAVLAGNPMIGRERPDVRPSVRSFPVAAARDPLSADRSWSASCSGSSMGLGICRER